MSFGSDVSYKKQGPEIMGDGWSLQRGWRRAE